MGSVEPKRSAPKTLQDQLCELHAATRGGNFSFSELPSDLHLRLGFPRRPPMLAMIRRVASRGSVLAIARADERRTIYQWRVDRRGIGPAINGTHSSFDAARAVSFVRGLSMDGRAAVELLHESLAPSVPKSASATVAIERCVNRLRDLLSADELHALFHGLSDVGLIVSVGPCSHGPLGHTWEIVPDHLRAVMTMMTDTNDDDADAPDADADDEGGASDAPSPDATAPEDDVSDAPSPDAAHEPDVEALRVELDRLFNEDNEDATAADAIRAALEHLAERADAYHARSGVLQADLDELERRCGELREEMEQLERQRHEVSASAEDHREALKGFEERAAVRARRKAEIEAQMERASQRREQFEAARRMLEGLSADLRAQIFASFGK